MYLYAKAFPRGDRLPRYGGGGAQRQKGCGVAYANNGQIKRVATSTFIITPYNVDIMGDLLDELENNGVFF